MSINLVLLQQMIDQKYINVQKHKDADLYIYNYSATVQYDRLWNEITLQCRGLILDANKKIVARPFKKFFNFGEFENQLIPDEPFEVYEKMDGSLGISYRINGEWRIATRGSFHSEQAERANVILYTKYSDAVDRMNPNYTYLFEIIYPQNRIVVDYGDEEKLVLLAVIDTQSGDEMAFDDIGFPIVASYDGINDIKALSDLNFANKEGFVLKFKDGYRIKVKFEEYLRIHRIVTCVSTISIWDYLKNGSSMDEIIERVPDEFFNWVKEQKQKLEDQYALIESKSRQDFKVFDTRKETAEYFNTCKYPGVLFMMLDGKNYSDAIWKLVKPVYGRPFLNEV